MLYLIAEAKKAGVRVKLAGEVKINPETGQLISTFRDTPPVPFETLELQTSERRRRARVELHAAALRLLPHQRAVHDVLRRRRAAGDDDDEVLEPERL